MGCIENELMYSPENPVDLSVLASVVPPPFNDSIVVTMDEKMGVVMAMWNENLDEALKTDCFSPSDVSFPIDCCCPPRDEAPSLPSITDCGGDANSRARIREHSNVNECSWCGDGVAEIRLEEDAGPPVEVVSKEFWGRYRAERIRTKEPQHGLQFSEKSVPSWND